MTYPLLNFNSATIEVQEWITNSIPHFTGLVIKLKPPWSKGALVFDLPVKLVSRARAAYSSLKKMFQNNWVALHHLTDIGMMLMELLVSENYSMFIIWKTHVTINK